MTKKLTLAIIFMCTMAIAITSCKQHRTATTKKSHKPKHFTIITVKPLSSKTTLYFSGQLQPAHKLSITSPVTGTIIEHDFSYGQYLKKSQLLFKIKSASLQTDYQKAMISYLKSKQTYNSSRAKFASDTKLYSKGLISKDSYTDTRNNYLLNRLAFTQARATLLNSAGKHNLTDIDKLSLDNIVEVTKRLNLQKDFQIVEIRAPQAGVALYTKNSKTELGSSVKKDQVICHISHKRQLASTIKINEVNVNQFHVGQPVTVTGTGFAPFTLHGYIESIAAQATDQEGLAIFSADIIIPKLSAEELNIVKFGMSIKIAITITHPPHIMIPIKAVNVDSSTVQIIAPKTGKAKTVTIRTGETTFQDVTILSGLKAGDKVIVPN